MTDKEIFSSNLKRLMNSKGVSPVIVCADLNIPMSTFSDWQNMKNYPRRPRLDALAEYFDVPRTELTEPYIDKKVVMGDMLFDGICEYMMEIDEKIPDFEHDLMLEYYHEIIDLYLNPEQMQEVMEYAEFIKARDEKKKDKLA